MAIYNDYKYVIEIKDQRSLDGVSPDGSITTNVLVIVYDAATKTSSTIYADGSRTVKTNPISRAQFTTDGSIVFYSPKTSHDIFIADEKGNTAFYATVTPNTRVLRLDTSGSDKMMVVPFSPLTAETDTGLDFPVNALVFPPVIEVVTADSTKTINVGLLSSESGGATAGFLNAQAVGATGFIRPFVITAGGTETYVSAGVVGSLIGVSKVGANTAGSYGVAGGYCAVITTATSLVYQCSSGSTTAAGYIYVPFKTLR